MKQDKRTPEDLNTVPEHYRNKNDVISDIVDLPGFQNSRPIPGDIVNDEPSEFIRNTNKVYERNQQLAYELRMEDEKEERITMQHQKAVYEASLPNIKTVSQPYSIAVGTQNQPALVNPKPRKKKFMLTPVFLLLIIMTLCGTAIAMKNSDDNISTIHRTVEYDNQDVGQIYSQVDNYINIGEYMRAASLMEDYSDYRESNPGAFTDTDNKIIAKYREIAKDYYNAASSYTTEQTINNEDIIYGEMDAELVSDYLSAEDLDVLDRVSIVCFRTNPKDATVCDFSITIDIAGLNVTYPYDDATFPAENIAYPAENNYLD